MPTIGRINTILSATTKPLTTGLSRAGTALKNFGGGIGGMVAKFTPLAAGLGGTAALLKGFNDVLSQGQGLTKLSAQTGASVESLSRMQAVASRLGIENDDLTGSIEELNIRLGETIRDGTGPAAEALKNLGLDAQTLANMPLEQRFAAIADQLNKIESPATLQFLADEIFGGDAFKILPLLKQGSAGIQEMIGEAERSGQVMSQSQVEAANKINKSWQSLKTGSSAIFTDIAKFAITSFNDIGFGGGDVFRQIREFTVDTLATIEFGFKNAGPITALLWEKIKLGAVSTFENLKHLFTVQVPTVITWLRDNWRDVFQTIFDFTTTVFINLGKNIRNAMKQIWDFIKSGGRKSLSITWTPLTEGFKNSVKELPDIPERAMTELEKKLTTNVETMGEKLGGSLGEFLLKRREEVFGADIKTPEFQAAATPALDFSKKAGEEAGKGLKSTLGELEGVAAVQRGSGDAFSQIFKAMRGEGDKGLKAQEQTAKGVSQAVTQLKKIAKNPSVQLVAGEV